MLDIYRVLLGVVVLPGDRSRVDDVRISRELDLRELKRRLVLRERSLGGIELGLVRTRINHEQELPFFEVVAILEMPLRRFARRPAELR